MAKICLKKRAQCIAMFNGGSTQREIARVLKISLCGVQNILKKFKSHETLENLPRKLTKADILF